MIGMLIPHIDIEPLAKKAEMCSNEVILYYLDQFKFLKI